MSGTYLEAAGTPARLTAQGPVQVDHLLTVVVHDTDGVGTVVATAHPATAPSLWVKHTTGRFVIMRV